MSETDWRARLQLSMEVAVSVALLDLYTTFHSRQFAVSRSSAHTYTTTSLVALARRAFPKYAGAPGIPCDIQMYLLICSYNHMRFDVSSGTAGEFKRGHISTHTSVFGCL